MKKIIFFASLFFLIFPFHTQAIVLSDPVVFVESNHGLYDIDDYLEELVGVGNFIALDSAFEFNGAWNVSAIGYEAGYNNRFMRGTQTLYANYNDTNFGQWTEINFDTESIYFSDPYDQAFFNSTYIGSSSSPSIEIYQLLTSATIFGGTTGYTEITLTEGSVIAGYNDSYSGDMDADDMIVVLKAVPEPATVLLFSCGLLAVTAMVRFRIRRLEQ